MKGFEILNPDEHPPYARLIPVQIWSRFRTRPLPLCSVEMAERTAAAVQACVVALPARSAEEVWCADDSLLWFRSLGFLKDPAFVAAHQPYAGHDYLRARLWRTYTAGWALKSCLHLDGAVVDIGCYNGVTDDVLYRYVGGDTASWYLYDVFDDPPTGVKKWAHGPELEAEVRAKFRNRANVSIIAGRLPATLATAPQRIACLLVDLNDPPTELTVLDRLYDAILPGGMVVLDDYGDNEFQAHQDRTREWWAARGHLVYECPTGQGLVIKR